MAGKRRKIDTVMDPWVPSAEDMRRLNRAETKYGVTTERFQQRLQALEEQAVKDWDLDNKMGLKRIRAEKAEANAAAAAAAEEAAIKEPAAKPKLAVSLSIQPMQQRRLSNALSPTSATTANSPHTRLSTPSSAEGENIFGVPDWYTKISRTSWNMKELERAKNPEKNAILKILQRLKDKVAECELGASTPQKFNDIRLLLHKAEFLPVDEYIVKKRHMLDNGLNRIFNAQGSVEFPWDLKADALQLYRRWAMKDFSIELLRGIITMKSENRSADRIDHAWRTRFSRLPNYYGEGKLVLGQWWPTQLCAVRDGAHGAPQAGIYGEKGKGAYSIVLADGGGYKDKDNGDEIFYSGTDSRDKSPTENTMRMIESCDIIKEPVRVIRSANLKEGNPYRPARGYRYDGLYDVVSYELIKEETGSYLFRLVRREGQNPIRYDQNPIRYEKATNKLSSRPTQQEIEAYDNEVTVRSFGLQAESSGFKKK